MADVFAAINFMLKQEDARLSGVITNIPGDHGGTTRFGITAKAASSLVAQGFFTEEIPADRALPMAQLWYQQRYAIPLQLGDIASQGIADALLSFAVNQESPGGSGRAVKLLQEACVALGATIAVDGRMGPHTVAAVNQHAPGLQGKYCELEQKFYDNIVAANPSQAKFLAGWTNRVKEDEAAG